jgi:TP901 family phage tail tape measure protein
MLNLKLAEAYVDIVANRSPFNSVLTSVIADLGRLKGLGAIPLTMNRAQATSSLGLLRQQLDELRKAASINVTMERRGGFGGRGGGFGGGGAGLGMGLMQGLGVAGFATNPAMMAGQMIGAGLKDAVSTAMELETTFVGLQRVSGESAANIERFKGAIFDIGKSQAGVSIKDLTDIAGAGAKAGITDKEGLAGLERFTAGMAKVRNSIQGIGTEQLANDMTRLLNLFHKGTDYVESFGSVLTRMDNVSTSSAADIMNISKSLAGTFASLGMTIPQVMAFSSVLSDVGLTNQQGAGSFSQILRMMASQSEEMAGLIGVPVEKFQQAIRTNAMDALGMLIGKFRELNEVDPVKAQEFLVSLGFRGVKTAGALQQLSSMFEQVQERTQMAIEEESSLGSLLSANALNSTTATANIQKLKNAFEELADAIGKQVVPHLTEMSKVALNLMQQMGGGKPGGPERLGFMEETEMKFMNMVGGEVSPEFEARRNDLNRRAEAFSASVGDLPLSAGPAANDVDYMKKEAARQAELGKRFARPGDESALALRVPGEGGAAPAPFAGLTDLAGKFEGAMEGATRAAEAETSTMAARGEMLRTPSGFAPQPFEQASEFARGFRDPADARDAKARAKEEAEAERAERKRTFRSQAFSDPAEFARSFITDMLSGKDDTPKKHLSVAERSLSVMEDIAEKLTPTFGEQTDKGPMIMRGASSPP